MTTWAGMRDTWLRYMLKDLVPASYRWSQAELLVYANAALDNLSATFPYEKTATITALAATYTYALPEDFRALDAVQWPSNQVNGAYEYVSAFQTKDQTWPYMGSSGAAAPTLFYMLGYPDETHITFTRVPPSSLTLYYRAWRTHLVADGDTLPFGSQWWMAEALVYYVAYQCYLRDAGPRAEMAQWAEKPELSMVNPLADQAEVWRRQYARLVQENQNRTYTRFTEAFKAARSRSVT